MTVSYQFGSYVLHDPPNGIYLLEKSYDMPPVFQSLIKLARSEGMKMSGKVVNERVITLKMQVIGVSRVDLETKLEALFQALSLQQQHLVIYATDARYFIADCVQVQNNLVAGQPISTILTLTFIATQPYAFAPTTSTFTTGNISATSSGGLCNFATFNVTGGGSAFSHPHITITQQGGTATSWTSLSLTQFVDLQVISVSTSLPTINTDRIDIYCDPTDASNGYTVQKNNSGTPIAFSGFFPVLEPQSTGWSLTIGASATTSVKCDFSWTSRWQA